jgi:signal transduction histidine kinase
MLRRVCGAARVEWWAHDDRDRPRLLAAAGDGEGRHHSFPFGKGGEVVVVGGRHDPQLASDLAAVASVLRRRLVEEQLTRTAMELARRNEELEDFSALVAHELKTPLLAALSSADPAPAVEQALDLVDRILEAAKPKAREEAPVSTGACLDEAVSDLDLSQVEVTSELTASFPFPSVQLRLILRNLLANAAAAGARHIHVAAVQSPGSWGLLVDDDGMGLARSDLYAGGSGVGLSLCRRLAGRFGGSLELTQRPGGGTRATLAIATSQ